MNKKYIIIITLAVVMLVVIAAFMFNSSNEKNIQDNVVSEEQIDNLPVELPQSGVMRVGNNASSDQIKKTYEDYINQDYRDFKFYEEDGISEAFSPSDKDVNLIPIGTFFEAIGANINPKVKEIIGTNYYGLFYCINDKKQKEYGIAFDVGGHDQENLDKYNAEAVEDMRAWEPYMLKDLHNILFPMSKLDEASLNQPLNFQDGKFRHAKLNLFNKETAIEYSIEKKPINRINITTSQACLQKSINYFESLD